MQSVNFVNYQKNCKFCYGRDKVPKNICWALGLVRGYFAVREQINNNEYVRFRTP